MKYITILIASTILTGVLYYSAVLLLSPARISAEYWVREAIVIKLDIAKKYSKRHKIVIASGSSALFGIDTQNLTKRLSMPVINLGLHAALSLEKILDVADKATNSGDTIILQLEVPKYNEGPITAWQARNIIAWEPKVWNDFTLPQRIEAINAVGLKVFLYLIHERITSILNPKLLAERAFVFNENDILKKFNPNIEVKKFAYSAYNLDSFGSMRDTNGSSYTGLPKRSPEDNILMSKKSLQLLTDFVNKMRIKGVKVCFAHNPYVKFKGFDMSSIMLSSDKFRKDLAKIAPVIDDKQDLIFDRKYFFDTEYHLNSEGRELNTTRFESAIRKSGLLSGSLL